MATQQEIQPANAVDAIEAELEARRTGFRHPDGYTDLYHRLDWQGRANAEMQRRGAAEIRGPMFSENEMKHMETAYKRGIEPEAFADIVIRARAVS